MGKGWFTCLNGSSAIIVALVLVVELVGCKGSH